MPGPWTATQTWATAHLVTALEMNNYLRDGLDALRGTAVGTTATFNNVAYTPITLGTILWDDLSVLSTSNAYQVVPWAGRYEVTFQAFWTGATGTGGMGVLVNHLDSGGGLLETIARQDSPVINGGVTAYGIGKFATSERIEFQAANSATGTAGSLALRATVAARG